MFDKNITAICFFFILIVPTPVFAGSHAVEVTPPGPKLVSPRAFVTLVFTIKNIGTIKDTFDLTLDLPENWNCISSLNPVTLKPGQHKKKLLTVSIPPTALSNIIYPVKLTVTSKADATIYATATAELRVKGVLGLRLAPEPYPKLAWAGETVNYGFEIRNLGNGDDTFEIEAHSSLGWKIKTSQQTLTLGPYQKQVVNVLLKVPRDIRQEQLHMLSFRVFSVKAKEQDKDISDETKIRLKTIAVADKKGKTYLELPGTMEIEFSEINDRTNGMPETKLRLETAGDLTEEYYSRLYFRGTFFEDEKEDEDYRFDLSKKEKWDLSLGHTYADFTRLTEDLSGEGISARTYGKQFETTFFAGCNDVESGDDEHDEYSIGANITALLGENSRVGLTSIFMDQECSAGNKGLYSLFGEYQLFEPLTLSGEIAYGSENTDTTKREDTAWFTRSDFNWKRLGLGAEYYHGGTDYPGGITDEEGFNIYSRYRLFEPFTLWADYHRYNDNVDDDPERFTIKTEKIRGGTQFRHGKWPTVDVTWEQEENKSSGRIPVMEPDIRETDRIEQNVILGLYKSFRYLTLSAKGEWGTERDLLRDISVSTSKYNATGSGYLKMFNWRLCYDRDDSLQEETDYQQITEKMEYELGCHLFNILSANVLYTDEVAKTNGSKTRKHTYDVDLDLTKRIGIGKGQSLGLKFEWDNVTEDEEEWKIGLVWRMKFGAPVPWIKIKGRVRGQLFLDEDGNGARGADEKVYPKTRITLNRMHVYTDEKGMFEFPVLDPGNYRLDMDMSQLPSGLIPAISLPRDISLSKGDEIFIDIPLEQVGTIRGTVFDDKNKNMQKDEEEDGLSPIRLILLKDGEEIQETFTDQQGRYILTDVTPGDYVIKIDREYLPHRYIMTTPKTIKVGVKSKEQITDINFGAYKKPRKIIKTFFKKKK
ncbi:MAG: hypothetical protein IMF11_19520 [Proteobacteria bacterium]|nr:hypothetical protein [Pseudomonadota bacterium]